MLNNAPVKTLKHDGLSVEGYSRAAVQSYWRIPELKLGFDLGAHPWDFMGVPTWFITHCHLDHIAALPLYVARRRLMKMTPPKIFLPAYAVDAVRKMLDSFQRLDRGRMNCDLIGVEGGQEIELSRELVVNVLKTKHTVPSVGYAISERRKKLKPEGLDDNPLFYETKILITEMTFIAADHRKELIRKNGHMHLDDFVERQNEFKNEIVIAGHFSTRYNMHQAKKIVAKRLPDMLDGRLKLWV